MLTTRIQFVSAAKLRKKDLQGCVAARGLSLKSFFFEKNAEPAKDSRLSLKCVF
jgi:hypothetical protein